MDEAVDVFVGNLPRSATESELKELFERYGEVTNTTIFNGGFGFVQMKNRIHAKAAIAGLNEYNWGSEMIKVEFSHSKQNKDRHWRKKNPNQRKKSKEKLVDSNPDEREPGQIDFNPRERSRSPLPVRNDRPRDHNNNSTRRYYDRQRPYESPRHSRPWSYDEGLESRRVYNESYESFRRSMRRSDRKHRNIYEYEYLYPAVGFEPAYSMMRRRTPPRSPSPPMPYYYNLPPDRSSRQVYYGSHRSPPALHSRRFNGDYAYH